MIYAHCSLNTLLKKLLENRKKPTQKPQVGYIYTYNVTLFSFHSWGSIKHKEKCFICFYKALSVI